MKIEKSSGVGGTWLPKKDLENGQALKLTTEAQYVEGQNGKQLVAKCKVKGMDGEFNLAINTPTKNALIEAFGDDSVNWVGKLLTVAVESGIFAGKRGIMLNLVPEGYVLAEDAAGYITIRAKVAPPASIAAEIDVEVSPDDIPF